MSSLWEKNRGIGGMMLTEHTDCDQAFITIVVSTQVQLNERILVSQAFRNAPGTFKVNIKFILPGAGKEAPAAAILYLPIRDVGASANWKIVH